MCVEGQYCRRDRGIIVHLRRHALTFTDQLLQIGSGALYGVQQALPTSM